MLFLKNSYNQIIKSEYTSIIKIQKNNKNTEYLTIYFQNLPINDSAKSKLDITSKELEEERTEANNVLKKWLVVSVQSDEIKKEEFVLAKL